MQMSYQAFAANPEGAQKTSKMKVYPYGLLKTNELKI